jgi:hypothetical protein
VRANRGAAGADGETPEAIEAQGVTAFLEDVRQRLLGGRVETKPITGTPQGGVTSPLRANVYLDVLDETWERESRHLGKLARFADDFVVLRGSRAQA